METVDEAFFPPCWKYVGVLNNVSSVAAGEEEE